MHVTVRMAWHDSDWNGTVCCDPQANTYCVGTHSLLSGRIEKKRNLEFETANAKKPACGLTPSQVPPCYWSINAFGQDTISIVHAHPFESNIAGIPDSLQPSSVFTWPFKLSFVHNKKNKDKQGNYPPDLEERVQNFTRKFSPGKSIVFFYANYDNPVSADDMRYLLLGCSVLAAPMETTRFRFTDARLQEIRGKSKTMRNFPTINWALKVIHDPTQAILLPYRQYLAHVATHPDDEELLTDMRIIVEEESLISGFKYVAMDIDDDKCLYLLYKLRRAIKKMQDHKCTVVKSDFASEEAKVTALIERAWQKRGIYPSLATVLKRFLPDEDCVRMAGALVNVTNAKFDLQTVLTGIVENSKVPEALEPHEDALLDLADSRVFRNNLAALVKLSLFNLTPHQIEKIVADPDIMKSLPANPYILFEEYQKDDDAHLDEPDLTDESIDLYKIDVGMIPDRKFVRRHRALQDLREDSPQRIRAVITDYLGRIGRSGGHCYDHIENVLDDAQEHPLIYRNEILIDRAAITTLQEDYRSHFIEKLTMVAQDKTTYFYLKPIRDAELQIKRMVEELTRRRAEHKKPRPNFKGHIQESIDKLRKRIPCFDEAQFREERTRLYTHILKKSLFLLTGRPGSGKTFEVTKIIDILVDAGEDVTVLAPTGKAALRLSQNIADTTARDLKADTIDRFLFKNDFGWAYDDWDRLDVLPNSEKITVENLIIDEASMIDLEKLKILLSSIRFDKELPRRIIMVGDENQLPPIGFGKPFHDIINYIQGQDDLEPEHYVTLRSNCRQENDPKILQLAEVFTDKKRYYEEALEMLNETGQLSAGLTIRRWRTRAELDVLLMKAIEGLLPAGMDENGKPLNPRQAFNRLLGLYDNGYVNNQDFAFHGRLKLDRIQCIAPYRGGSGGTVTVNSAIQTRFRKNQNSSELSTFYHSDKVIRIAKNWYRGWGKDRELVLSNGSIGIITGEGERRKYYFADADRPFLSIDSEENFDLAYAITVHKAQGSDFEDVLLVIPERLTLLTKELVYTALTRSRQRLTIFLQEAEENPLEVARNRSSLLNRNTSVFSAPADNKSGYQPRKGIFVKSRIEYIIHKALERSGLKFEYEEILPLPKRTYVIKPDFTIHFDDGTRFFWEHLGKLDCRKYSRDWQRRMIDFKDHGLFDAVVTTDDLGGIDNEKLDQVIQDIRRRNPANTKGNAFSNHHYRLY
jgi:ATP-dependent exoDNAse (exonuclease V) alpha subunit